MTDRFPLILDTDSGNRIKELPSGDNLDLTGSSIVKAASIETVGNLSAVSLTVNGENLSTVATSGDYNDLLNIPQSFSGSYNDLANKPNIPERTFNLDDVSGNLPNNGDALVWDETAGENGEYVPTSVLTELDLSGVAIEDLNNVISIGVITDKYLKFTAGAWRPSNVNWADVKNKPVNVSAFINDAGYIRTEDIEDGTLTIDVNNTGDLYGSVFADDSTPLVDAINGTLPYNPAVSSNWAGDSPNNVYEALDRIAAALTALGQQP